MSRAYVLLSGGIDSTTCLHIAGEVFGGPNVLGLTINYGQRHIKEQECAKRQCDLIGAKHKVLTLSIPLKSALTDDRVEIPDMTYDEIDGVSPMYVPYRNGLMLSHLTSFASQDDEAEAIYFGAHAEDARNWAYPDCTPEFIGAMANAIYIGTYHKLRLITPFTYSSKGDVIREGMRLEVPYKDTWSCYKGEEVHCGACPTCYARRDAFTAAGHPDPTIYASSPEERND